MTKPTLAASLALALISAPTMAQAPDVLFKEIVTGMPQIDRQEIKILSATLKPGKKTPFHTHQYPVTTYILEGTFTLEMEGRPALVKNAGEAFTEPPNVKMTGYNRGSGPMRALIFYVSGPGEPFLHIAH